jgi:CheY-like chemotaxis protein
VGHGSTFKIYIPSARLKTVSHAPQTNSRDRHAPHVLIVDDDHYYVEMIRQVIVKQGLEATAVTSGEEALEFLSSHEADLVLLDIIMPELSGIDTCRRLREIRPNQRVIFMSGTEDNESAHIAEQLSDRAFLHKPFDMNFLKTVVAEELLASRPDGIRETGASTAGAELSAPGLATSVQQQRDIA